MSGRKRKGIPAPSESQEKATVWRIEWDDTRIVNLIGFYQDHPYMWNVKLPHYKNKAKKRLCVESWLKQEDLWDDNDGHDLVDEVFRKFHSLRTRYGTESKKIREKTSGSGAESDDEEIYSTWEYFKSLKFLKDVIVTRRAKSNLAKVPTKIVQAPADPEPLPPSVPVEIENEQSNEQASISYILATDENGANSLYAIQTDTGLPPLDAKDDSDAEMNEPVPSIANKDSATNSARAKIPRKSTSNIDAQVAKCLQALEKKEDREDLFFNYCAETMRQLPNNVREKARIEIQNLLNKYVLEVVNAEGVNE